MPMPYEWVPKAETLNALRRMRAVLGGVVLPLESWRLLNRGLDALEMAARNGCAGPGVEAILWNIQEKSE